MYKIMICDDHFDLCIYIQEQLLKEYPNQFMITPFRSTRELVKEFEKMKGRCVPDIILMDIDINGVNGIEFIDELQSQYSEMKIIFITGHIDYATDIFTVNPSYFLVHPIQIQKLTRAIDTAIYLLNK